MSIVWLASYPKSGNTWFRAFLANLERDNDQPARINALGTGEFAAARRLFDDLVGIDAADLTPDQVDALRPAVYRTLAAQQDQRAAFHKVHDAYVVVGPGSPLIPADATRGAIYFIRNPLDVAISYAHHRGVDVDTAIGMRAHADHCISADGTPVHGWLRQRLLTWSAHVTSWIDQTDVPVHVVRYEDMHRCPEPTFAAAAAFAGLPTDPQRVARAIAHSTFSELQQQEVAGGFAERAPSAPSFFRRGQVGSWRDELIESQVERLAADHRDVMARFGYLDASGSPLC